MKFLHTADLHLDSPLHGLERYPGAPVARIRAATRQALERLVDLFKKEFVLIFAEPSVTQVFPFLPANAVHNSWQES